MLSKLITEFAAAHSLALRAFSEQKQSSAFLLIESACKLDTTLPEQGLKSQWLNAWLKDNQNRSIK